MFDVEYPFDNSLVGSRSHDIRGRTVAKQKADRIDQQAFSGSPVRAVMPESNDTSMFSMMAKLRTEI